jgi:hypothetical protein
LKNVDEKIKNLHEKAGHFHNIIKRLEILGELLKKRPPGCFSGGLRFLWSWRGLNPRPNEQQKCFLHAYPLIGVSALNREKATLSAA